MRLTAGCRAAALFVVFASAVAVAEKVPMSEEGRKAEATHILKGTVEQVFSRKETKPNGEVVTKYVAELKIAKVEKGEGLKEGQLAYVRYWHISEMKTPGASGQAKLPKAGDTVTVFVERAEDGAMDALFPNGMEFGK